MAEHRQSLEDLKAALRSGRTRIRTHSGKVEAGDIFLCLPGAGSRDTGAGASHCREARERGAAWIVCAPGTAVSAGQDPGCVVVEALSPADALGELCAARFGTDSLPFPIVGVTGTNGKTTISYLLEYMWQEAGRAAGVLGTVSYRWPGHAEDAPLTTPDCLALHAMCARMREAGVEELVMECSSHALDQKRVAALPFSGAIFTNLTQDHLDYHADMEAYFLAKARLFLEMAHPGKAVAINADDPYGRRLLERLVARGESPVGYGLGESPVPGSRHLGGTLLSCTPDGLELEMRFEGERWRLSSPLVGAFNAQNLLAVQAYLLQRGFGARDFARLEAFKGVPGRLERVPNGRGLDVFVDYAHTPDALTKTLEALRKAGFRRVLTVFGCGGDRDRGKRPKMARAAAALSDVVVLTSDNPRTESPLAIMADARAGFAGCAEEVQIVEEPDRAAATRIAVSLMRPGDALLVAGKGHETYQIIGTTRHAYSDQETLREILACQ